MYVVNLLLAVLSFPLLCAVALTLLLTNAVAHLTLRRNRNDDRPVDRRRASIVIPNWNGRELLEECLPSVVAAAERDGGGHEIIVVDNGSDDDSVPFLRSRFPQVRVVELGENLGFAGGCNRGVQECQNDVVVLLNNDMVVREDFLRPLLGGFADERVFAVTSQIFFQDASRRREETGRTRGTFRLGRLVVGHDQVADNLKASLPVFYAGGGSTAYDRRKFLAMGGFDELFRPFYGEDTDLSYRAWRRGWHVLFQPRSVVYHKHRGTIGRHFSRAYIADVVERNHLLFVWKNVSDWRILLAQGFFLPAQYLADALRGRLNLRPLRYALPALPQVLWRILAERRYARVADRDVLRLSSSPFRFREKYAPPTRRSPQNGRLNILFLSPYFPYPPSHGGAVRMYNIIKQLSQNHSITLLSFIEHEDQRAYVGEMAKYCDEVRAVLRRPRLERHNPWGTLPLCVTEFSSEEMYRAVDEVLGTREIDIVQIEYTQMAQYAVASRHVACFLTEHDLSFLSAYRHFRLQGFSYDKMAAFVGWLKMMHYELSACRKFDAVLTVTAREKEEMQSYLPELTISAEAPTGVDTAYFRSDGPSRAGKGLLFVGYFNHLPNVDAILCFCRQIYPLLQRRVPGVNLTIVGQSPPPVVRALAGDPSIVVTGYVEDLRPYYHHHAVFVAPVRFGAGVRVKILEAMAAGIPVVTTRLGCEGIECLSGRDLLVADGPDEFAEKTAWLLEKGEARAILAANARRLVEGRYDWRTIGANLEAVYRRVLAAKRGLTLGGA